MAVLIILAVIVLVPVGWLIGTYNGLVRLRQHVKESWSGIDTELKRRYELIPNLVATCKGYAAHERAVFEQVAQARAAAIDEQGGVERQADRENALSGSLRTMFAVADDYPELQASGNFLALQRELANTEDRIQAARRFYNANVRDLNTRVQSFPSNLVAQVFGFESEAFFEVQEAAVRVAPVVDLG